jgi:hypothetical protein
MSRESETSEIQLGGRTYSVAGFTFDQLQEMLPHFVKLRAGLDEEGFAAARAILKAALSDQVDGEAFEKVKTNVVEVLAAMPVVAKVSGLAELGEAVRGMAAAVAP